MSFRKKIKTYLRQGIFLTHFIRYIFFTKKVYKLFTVLLPFIKIRQNRIFCDHFGGGGYGDNPKYIAEKLHEKCLEYEIFLYMTRKSATKIPFRNL